MVSQLIRAMTMTLRGKGHYPHVRRIAVMRWSLLGTKGGVPTDGRISRTLGKWCPEYAATPPVSVLSSELGGAVPTTQKPP